jgi:hypothetical protein
MENEETGQIKNPVETPSPQATASPPPYRPDNIFLGLCIIVSILAGSLSGWLFSKANAVDVYVVDVKSIVDDKRRELVEMYKKNPTDETIAVADKELSEFLIQLEQGITRLGSGTGKIVLLKDVYLAGNAEDATDYLRPKKKKHPKKESGEPDKPTKE